jgi:hypothetical protein
MSQSKFGDFLNFRVMISPIVILILFWLGLAAIVIVGIGLIVQGKTLIGIGTIVLGPFAWRIICEYMIIGFRLHDCLEKLAKSTEIGPLPYKKGDGRVDTRKQKEKEFGLPLSEIMIGERYETKDGRQVKIIEITGAGLKVDTSTGMTEMISPIDSGMPQGLWTFDIRRI